MEPTSPSLAPDGGTKICHGIGLQTCLRRPDGLPFHLTRERHESTTLEHFSTRGFHIDVAARQRLMAVTRAAAAAALVSVSYGR